MDHVTAMVRSSYVSIQFVFVVVLTLLWDGLPIALIGLPKYLGKHVVAFLICALLVIFLIRFCKKSVEIWQTDFYSISLFILLVSVSLISNTIINPIPPETWIFSQYFILPLLVPFAFRAVNVNLSDLVNAFVFLGVFTSLLLLFDQFFYFNFLDDFTRTATAQTGLRRVVLLKTETSISFCIILSRLLYVKSFLKKLLLTLAASVIGYNLCIISESRLAIAAAIVGISLFVLFQSRGLIRLRYAIYLLITIASASPFVFGKYFDKYLNSANYLTDDASISWRLIEFEYFYQHFLDSEMMGFGSMTTAPGHNNILSFAESLGGNLYGSETYGLYLADIGIFAALFQFGPLAFVLVTIMSLKMSFGLMCPLACDKTGRDAAAIGAASFGFMFSPLPMNFFTLEWCIFTGSLIWYTYSCVQRGRQEVFVKEVVMPFARGRSH